MDSVRSPLAPSIVSSIDTFDSNRSNESDAFWGPDSDGTTPLWCPPAGFDASILERRVRADLADCVREYHRTNSAMKAQAMLQNTSLMWPGVWEFVEDSHPRIGFINFAGSVLYECDFPSDDIAPLSDSVKIFFVYEQQRLFLKTHKAPPTHQHTRSRTIGRRLASSKRHSYGIPDSYDWHADWKRTTTGMTAAARAIRRINRDAQQAKLAVTTSSVTAAKPPVGRSKGVAKASRTPRPAPMTPPPVASAQRPSSSSPTPPRTSLAQVSATIPDTTRPSSHKTPVTPTAGEGMTTLSLVPKTSIVTIAGVTTDAPVKSKRPMQRQHRASDVTDMNAHTVQLSQVETCASAQDQTSPDTDLARATAASLRPYLSPGGKSTLDELVARLDSTSGGAGPSSASACNPHTMAVRKLQDWTCQHAIHACPPKFPDVYLGAVLGPGFQARTDGGAESPTDPRASTAAISRLSIAPRQIGDTPERTPRGRQDYRSIDERIREIRAQYQEGDFVKVPNDLAPHFATWRQPPIPPEAPMSRRFTIPSTVMHCLNHVCSIPTRMACYIIYRSCWCGKTMTFLTTFLARRFALNNFLRTKWHAIL